MTAKKVVEQFPIEEEELVAVSAKKVSMPTAAEVDKRQPSVLGGVDISDLSDDSDEDDDPMGAADPQASVDRWVFAKFVSANLHAESDYTIRRNGVEVTLPRGKWVITRFANVLLARQSGVLDFIRNPGQQHMRPSQNKPSIEVKEIADKTAQKDIKGILAFRDKVSKAKGKEMPIAPASVQ